MRTGGHEVHRSRKAIAVATVATIAAGIGAVAMPLPAAAYQKLKPQVERSVPAAPAPPSPKLPPDPAAGAALTAAPAAPAWPAAASATVDLSPSEGTDSAARAAVQAAGTPVRLGRAVTEDGQAVSARVQVFDHARADAAGAAVLVGIARADGGSAAAKTRVALDYSGLRGAFGADWATRLRLVQLVNCAPGEATPSAGAAGCERIELQSTNDTAAGVVSAEVSFAGTQVMLAVAAAPSGAAGDYAATKLAPSSTWEAGSSSGDFSWSYPMRMPPGLGGPVPDVALSYSSQSVDGHSAASNNQPSWVGEGFDYGPGAISRSYKACSEDMGGTANNTTKTGDQCWASWNASMSLPGHGGELIRDDATGAYHLKNDDGTKIELLTGAANGDDNGEYWRITTTDGVKYYFGLNRLSGWTTGKPQTGSAFTVPVFGNNTGEPCHQTTFAASQCSQAYQWNLDYVVDTYGNTMSYWYTQETNRYARNNTDTLLSSYTRGGYLTRIDYGTDNRSGTDTEFTANPPMRVVFTPADRCIPGTTCDIAHKASWPDVPWDFNCATTATSCPGLYTPSFWTQKRLASVTTQVSSGSAYRNVEQWTLTHSYPDPGDATRAGLWLEKISHTGLVGATTAMPDVTFTGVQMPNRVDTSVDGSPAMNWWRISSITSESGGITGVTYSGRECAAGSTPASPSANTKRCFPVFWTRSGQTDPTIDWFHKYVVTAVTDTDTTGHSPRVITAYSYPSPPAWHYDADEGLVPPARKTWAQWRGYDQVNVTTGDPGEQTYTVNRFFRGMNGDHLPSGTRSVSIDGIADEEAYAGMLRQSTTYNGPTGAEVSSVTHTPWQSAATATRTIGGITVTARLFNPNAVVQTRTALDGNRPARVSTVTTTLDPTYGYATQIADNGDDAIATDDRCTLKTYTNNTSAWIIGSAIRTQVLAIPCGQTPSGEGQVISDSRSLYDGQAFGAAPTKGDVTQTEIAKSWVNPTSVTYIVGSRAAYDAYGRITDSWDVRGNDMKTAYTPASGGPVTKRTTTNALGWVSTADVEPAWGQPLSNTDQNGQRTDLAYDGLGRLTGVWLPGRAKLNQTANLSFVYTVSRTGISSTTAAKLNAAGNYITTYTLFDSLMRPRQVQNAPAADKGRILTDTFYDTAGRVVKTNAPYQNGDAGPGTVLFTAQDNQVPSQIITVYDGAGRVTASIQKSDAVEKWRTTTAYGGDRTYVTPPAGATATSNIVDVRGNATELRQYQGPGPSGSYDATTYGYDPQGRPKTVTDPAGNTWTYGYDLLGRTTSAHDPDSGDLTSTYNDIGDLLTTTDGRGQVLAYKYDSIGRKIEEHATSLTGPLLASWSYDTAFMPDGVTRAKGQLAATNRFVSDNAYTTSVRGYTGIYSPTGTDVTIPASEGALAGTYSITNTYNVDGSLNSTRLPSAGGLDKETLTYGYDATTGLPTTLNTNYGGIDTTVVTNTEYTALGEPAVTTYSTGGLLAQQALYYDEVTRRISESVVQRETAPSAVADVHYGYDQAGNVTRIADTPTGGTADVQCFSNDYLQRLKLAWTPADGICNQAPSQAAMGGAASYWEDWAVDPAGNRLTQTDHATAKGDVTTTSSYPAAGGARPHTLTATSTKDLTGTRTATYAYDQAGNTISRPGPAGQQSLSWDAEERLATLTDNSGTASYIYGADGSRLLARDPQGTTLDLGPVELRLTASSGSVAATHYYTFLGNAVAQRSGTTLSWLFADAHGTGQVAMDAATQAVTQRRFTPFGTPRGTAPTWLNDKGFVGGTTDPTGLTQVGARQYDPGNGRFISDDPITDAKHPQALNGYAYANNSPYTFTDPTGLMYPSEGGGTGGGGGGGGGKGGGKGGGGKGGGGNPGQSRTGCGGPGHSNDKDCSDDRGRAPKQPRGGNCGGRGHARDLDCQRANLIEDTPHPADRSRAGCGGSGHTLDVDCQRGDLTEYIPTGAPPKSEQTCHGLLSCMWDKVTDPSNYIQAIPMLPMLPANPVDPPSAPNWLQNTLDHFVDDLDDVRSTIADSIGIGVAIGGAVGLAIGCFLGPEGCFTGGATGALVGGAGGAVWGLEFALGQSALKLCAKYDCLIPRIGRFVPGRHYRFI
jgi:RHS repeat-associated protein